MEFNIDAETFVLFQAGDRHAYQEIRRVIYLLCYKRLQDKSLATTAADRILKNIKDAKNIENIKAYLSRTIYNTCTSMWREQGGDQRRLFQAGEEFASNELSISEWRRALRIKDAYDAVMEEAERLPRKLRKVFMMRHKEGLSPKEIIERTRIPSATVYRRLDESLEWVRNELRKKGWKIIFGIILLLRIFF